MHPKDLLLKSVNPITIFVIIVIVILLYIARNELLEHANKISGF
jgi:hypothetical protein